MSTLVISDLTQDVSQFVAQFESVVASKPTWKGTLTTMTSQTLIELISSVGTFNQARISRAFEDSFAETAQSDDAIRSITQMQGLRLSRKLPAALTAAVKSDIDVTLNPMTQFMAGGQYYFNRKQVTLEAGVEQNIELSEGQVFTYAMSGLGSPHQSFISEEDSFAVSDQDVCVYVNGTAIPKSFGTLWNYANLPAFADMTTADGRLLLVFGSQQFGTTPQPNDSVVIQYAVTQGADGANQTLVGRNVTVDGISNITGTALTNPTGGGNEQPIQTYKNLSSGSFGTYSSAVTKAQYLATVGVYPGVIDAYTQAQREINPMDHKWMNVIRVSALTTSEWTQQQKRDYCEYLQTVTMYAPTFVWQDPIPVQHDVEVTVHCFNSAVLSRVKADCELAIRELFAPRAGLLLTNFYEFDLANVCKKAGKGSVSYVVVDKPTDPMIVTAPLSPKPEFEVVSGLGTLSELMYAYGIATVNAAGEEGPPSNWVFPQVIGADPVFGVKLKWNPLANVTAYKVYGRKAGSIGLLATIAPTDPLEFVDDGSITPGTPFVASQNVRIRYNTLGSLKVNVVFAERQQRFDDTPTRGVT